MEYKKVLDRIRHLIKNGYTEDEIMFLLDLLESKLERPETNTFPYYPPNVREGHKYIPPPIYCGNDIITMSKVNY